MARISTAGYEMPQRATKSAVTLSGGDISALTQPTREVGAIGATVASLGARIADEALETNANREFANIRAQANQQMSEMENFARENNDFNSYQPEWEKRQKVISDQISGLSRRGKERVGNWWQVNQEAYNSQVDNWVNAGIKQKAAIDGYANIEQIISGKYETEAAAETARRRTAGEGAGIISEEEYKLAEIDRIIKENTTGIDPPWTPGMGQAIREQAIAGIETNNIIQTETQLKDELISVLGDSYDKQAGYELLDEYYKKNLITAEQNKKLGDWMDSYASGRAKMAEVERHDAVLQDYKNLSQKLPKGEVSYDDIERTRFDEDTKKIWRQMIKGSFEPASSSTYEGVSSVVDTIMEFNTLQTSRQDAYNLIMKARFIDKSISDDDYAWALNRIEKPYPKHVAENTQAVMKASEKYYHQEGVGFFGRDWIDAQEQQLLTAKKKAFLSWLDDEIEGGKYPGGKDMYAKMKEMDALAEEPQFAPGGMYGHLVASPDPKDPLYITTDEQYDKISEETAFYDGLTGSWLYKPKKKQSVAEEPEGIGKQVFNLENIRF